MAWCCDYSVWLIGLFVLYKVLDWVIRIPKINRPDLKYVVVTGCDTGFGHEIAKRLDSRGVHVIATCLTDKGETELRKVTSHRMKTIHMDVSDPASVRRAFREVKDHIPEGKGLWGLLNNAGISSRPGPLEWLEIKDYQKVLDVNLLGLIDVTMTFLPLIKQARGRVANTASVFGRYSLVGAGPYCISKYGVEAFSDTLRRQCRAFGVKVLLVEPGFHKTNMADTAVIERGVRESFANAPKEAQEEYGQEYVEKSIGAILNTVIAKVMSDRISDVVDGYEHAMLGMFPRARYVIGRDAKYMWLPLQWVPEWFGDWFLEVTNPERPLPAACLKK